MSALLSWRWDWQSLGTAAACVEVSAPMCCAYHQGNLLWRERHLQSLPGWPAADPLFVGSTGFVLSNKQSLFLFLPATSSLLQLPGSTHFPCHEKGQLVSPPPPQEGSEGSHRYPQSALSLRCSRAQCCQAALLCIHWGPCCATASSFCRMFLEELIFGKER